MQHAADHGEQRELVVLAYDEAHGAPLARLGGVRHDHGMAPGTPNRGTAPHGRAIEDEADADDLVKAFAALRLAHRRHEGGTRGAHVEPFGEVRDGVVAEGTPDPQRAPGDGRSAPVVPAPALLWAI